MNAAVAIAALVAACLALDQVGLWAERRGWIYWRKRRPPVDGGAVTGAFGEIQSLLSPSHRHVVDEQRTQKSLRHDASSGDGTRMRIDLGGGTVRLDRPRGSGD
ncbi:DUF6191 domain-containing protein [Rhodococcus oryzae]|uniref:DUF6191 domain-containing protein n=1 Tax=Rhodococcus oryzae TaxID=2571143 RepID=UPI0037B7301F